MAGWPAVIALLLAAAAAAAAAGDRLALSGAAGAPRAAGGAAQWRLTNANRSVSLPAAVPGYALEILRAAGVVQDPLYRFGELEARWVAKDTWNFSAVWPGAAHAALARRAAVALRLGGADAAARVNLNGRDLGETDNAHRYWLYDVTRHLREGANLLQIIIRPAVDEALRRKREYPYPVPTLAAPGAWDVFNFLRKPASDFGWDWGPAFGAAGLSGAVELIAFDRALLTGANAVVSKTEGEWLVEVEGVLLAPPRGDAGRLSAEFESLGLRAEAQVELRLGAGGLEATGRVALRVPAGRVELWWPVGMGGQPLYDLTVGFTPDGESCAPPSAPELRGAGGGTCAAEGACEGAGGGGGGECSALLRRVGFRTAELVTASMRDAAAELLPKAGGGGAGYGKGKGAAAGGAAGGGGKGGWCLAPGGRWVNAMGKGAKPSWWWPPQAPDRSWPAPPGHEAWEPSEAEGSAFYFRVNGQPVYAKGANLIPLSVLPTNVTGADLRRLLDDALDAHMNMVRIWGGGVYPSDDLYDYADERGIMIWQETAFACAPYPRDPAFLDNVRVEVEQQARRLGWHASVVIWGGNNEVEASMEWYEDTRSNAALYAVDYDRLFVDTIGGVLQKLAPSTPFVDSSPSNGMVSPRLGVKRWANAQDPRHGDVHYYNYAADCQDWRHYPRARFVSEYGWQSYPTWPTYRAATAAPDWSVASEMHEYRQRHPNGTREILAQLDRRFTLPPSWRTLLKGRPAAAGSGRGLAEAEAMEEAAAAGGGGGAARDARQEEYRSFIY
ncbi:MAG: glycoside hydrolase superfamily, partial [Monoraphidium minutum]